MDFLFFFFFSFYLHTCTCPPKLTFSPNLHLVNLTKSGYIGIKYIMPSWVKIGGYKITTTQHPPQPPSYPYPYPYPSNPYQYHSSYYGYNHNLYHHGFDHNGYHQVGYKYYD